MKTNDQHSASNNTRTARCACGSFQVTVSGEPLDVYACSCLECQRATGSVLAYRAWFKTSAIERLEGERRGWRRTGRSGRWVEQTFCPVCGSIVYVAGEGLPDAISISVGCFADPGFATPASAHWMSQKHGWFMLSDVIEVRMES